METKEKEFGGTVLNGFLFLFVNIVLTLASLAGIIYGIVLLADDNETDSLGGWLLTLGLLALMRMVMTPRFSTL